MDVRSEIIDAIEILVDAAMKNTTKIYTCVVKNFSGSKCTVLLNGQEYVVKYYGEAPKENVAYPIFVPQGNFSLSFIITS